MTSANRFDLLVEQVSVFYGHIQALNDVTMTIPEGRIVSIVGANGAGKSTLLMTLAGVLKPKSGVVTFGGQPLADAPHKVLASGISLVPERRRLYANLTVRENLLMGAHMRKDMADINGDLEAMMALFPIIRERLKQYAGTLSGGEQQMVALARGLMSRPKLLLLDEPSLGLAPLLVKQVFETVVGLKEQGITVFLAEQNAFQSLEISDYAYVLETGRVALEGGGRQLLDDQRVREAYLGLRKRVI